MCFAALDHASLRSPASARQHRRIGRLRVSNVGGCGEHRDAVRDLLPVALGGQSVRGLPHLINQPATYELHARMHIINCKYFL